MPAPSTKVSSSDTGTNLIRVHNVSRKATRQYEKSGLEETEISITGKLARGTFAASFFLACLEVLEMDGVQLQDL